MKIEDVCREGRSCSCEVSNPSSLMMRTEASMQQFTARTSGLWCRHCSPLKPETRRDGDIGSLSPGKAGNEGPRSFHSAKCKQSVLKVSLKDS